MYKGLSVVGNSKSHILDFSAKSNIKRSQSESRPLPVLVEQARSIFVQELDKLLHSMLEQADDYLFNMSDSGYNNAHFDAMRLLRMKKKELLGNFQQELKGCFNEYIGKSGNYGDDYFENNEMSFENIALVEDNELEEGIAIDGIVKKARTANNEAIEQIRTRLDALITNKSVTQENNPFEPAFICNAFKNATLALEMDINSLLVIYKLFERIVASDLQNTYAEVNEFFIQKGVLPDLKNIRRKAVQNQNRGHSSSQWRSQEVESLQGEPVESSIAPNVQANEEQVLSLMQSLLVQAKAGHYSQSSSTSSAAIQGQERTTNTPSVNTAELIGALTQLQSSSNTISGNENVVANIRNTLGAHLPQATQDIKRGGLGQYNDDMIDIVSMLFDFILDDKNLHVEIKSVIARLQIPMLKVGLVDRSFFSNKNHPARILLNEIARAGLSWEPSDVEAQKMLDKIESVCDEIISNFKDDVSLFDVLLEDFQNFREQALRRADIFERRTRESEEGKAKAESARGVVNNELEKICRKKHLPESARMLLKNVWVHVMLLEQLKNNEEGWEKACKVAKLLVWSVQPVHSGQALEKLLSRIPPLVKNLRKGFSIVSLSPIEATHLLDKLEETHREIIKNVQDEIEQGKQEEILRLEPAPFVTGRFTGELEKAEKPEKTELVLPKEEPIEEVEIQEIAFSADEIGKPKQLNSALEVAQHSYQMVNSLSAGNWVELTIKGELKRSKLAAKISSTEKFIFVNRNGVKIAEFYVDELAIEYQLGRLKILDDEALFDRALESVISNLRAMKAEA